MEALCQRCGEMRERDQEYCLECGARLPGLDGALPRVRRVWVRRLGWYPGDWAFVAAGTLLVALVGAVAAIVLTSRATAGGGRTIVVSTIPGLAREAPSTVPGAGGVVSSWPAGAGSWTIILASYPVSAGDAGARAAAEDAARKGLKGVGLLTSSDYPALQPGYLIVFDGIYPTQADATAALGSVKAAGFAGAYTRRVAR
jgi:hypothetical protein